MRAPLPVGFLVSAGLLLGLGEGAVVAPPLPDAAVVGHVYVPEPTDVAVNPATNLIYVSSNSPNVGIAVIDGVSNEIVATVAQASTPLQAVRLTAVEVNPVTNVVYAADQIAGLWVVDGATNSVVTHLPRRLEGFGFGPHTSLDVNVATDRVYVSNDSEGKVAVIDGAKARETASISVPWPSRVAVDMSSNRVYVAGGTFAGGTFTSIDVHVMDGERHEVVQSISLPARNPIFALAVDHTRHRVYAFEALGPVWVIDGATSEIITAVRDLPGPAGGVGRYLAVNPATGRVYAATTSLSAIGVGDHAIIASFSLPGLPYSASAVAVNPVTNHLYIATLMTNTVLVVDATKLEGVPEAARGLVGAGGTPPHGPTPFVPALVAGSLVVGVSALILWRAWRRQGG